MRKIDYNSQRDNFTVSGISGSSQCFATSAWMFISWYNKSVNALDDAGLKKYIAELTAKSSDAEYEWADQKKMIEKYAGIKMQLGIDLNNGKPLCHDEGLRALLSCGPVIVGTKKMSGLPGGHIILAVDNGENGRIICHDPYGNANTNYSDKNGAYVLYDIKMLDANYPDMIRAMYKA